MKQTKIKGDFQAVLGQVKDFVNQSDGLHLKDSPLMDYVVIEQKTDGHKLTFNSFDLEEVLMRTDEKGENFLQVNFISGKKILVTDSLIGFRPLGLYGLDMEKLPKVVTTPDIQSVFEAIQESLQSNDEQVELDVLRKVFDSVLCGGEAVGFDLKEERALFACIPTAMQSGAA